MSGATGPSAAPGADNTGVLHPGAAALLVCGDCGEVHRWTPLDRGRIAHCSRCDAVLARGHRLGISSLLALTVAAAVVLLIANTAALVSIRLGGTVVATNLPSAIAATWRDGAPLVAVLASFTAIVAPALFIGLRLWLLLPLALGRLPVGLGPCLRVLHTMAHWNTVSVLAVGALLSLVRMAALAQVSPGPGLAAIGALAILLAALESAGLRHLWPADAGARAVANVGADDRPRPPARPEAASSVTCGAGWSPTDAAAGLRPRWVGCECCGWIGQVGVDPADVPEVLRCARCEHPLAHPRDIGLQRTWALLVASAVLLLPANLLPMMSTVQALRSTPHTLLGGIAELWSDGAWGLAVLVFIASIVVPLLKIVALALLAWSIRHAPHWRPVERSRLYRLVQAVGHWSMLDVYVVLLLVGMVRFGNFAGAEPGPALLAFAATVVLTMLATHGFDPRWIWQTAPARSPAPLPLHPAPKALPHA